MDEMHIVAYTKHAHSVIPSCFQIMRHKTSDILDWIHTCASGDIPARHSFQAEYGEDIYNFPLKIYGLPAEEAGDFYIYVFENDRIFTRLESFSGRNNIQFRTFLSYYVLKHLFFEWQRTRKEIETISLNSLMGGDTQGERTLEDTLPAPAEDEARARGEDPLPDLWANLSTEEQLDLKLLSLIEYDLSPDDIRLLARISARSIRETLVLLTEVQTQLRQKDERISRLRADLDSVWGWIVLRQKELQQINEKIHHMSVREADPDRVKLLDQKQTLEQALTKRYRQKEKLMVEIRRYKLTTPYKDMARLLNTTVGTLGSRISRLRSHLEQEFDLQAEKEGTCV